MVCREAQWLSARTLATEATGAVRSGAGIGWRSSFWLDCSRRRLTPARLPPYARRQLRYLAAPASSPVPRPTRPRGRKQAEADLIHRPPGALPGLPAALVVPAALEPFSATVGMTADWAPPRAAAVAASVLAVLAPASGGSVMGQPQLHTAAEDANEGGPHQLAARLCRTCNKPCQTIESCTVHNRPPCPLCAQWNVRSSQLRVRDARRCRVPGNVEDTLTALGPMRSLALAPHLQRRLTGSLRPTLTGGVPREVHRLTRAQHSGSTAKPPPYRLRG